MTLEPANASSGSRAEHAERPSENGFVIRRVTLDDLDELLAWRMEVLHEVFATAPADAPTASAALPDAPAAPGTAAPTTPSAPRATTHQTLNWDTLRTANRAYYQRALADGTHIACFAEFAGVGQREPIACGSICLQTELPSPDNPTGICAYLMNMYTRPAHRGKGVASAVVDWVVDQARNAGAGKIYLETTPQGRSVYARAGFVDLPDMMKLPG